jgi:hypothetical protein
MLTISHKIFEPFNGFEYTKLLNTTHIAKYMPKKWAARVWFFQTITDKKKCFHWMLDTKPCGLWLLRTIDSVFATPAEWKSERYALKLLWCFALKFGYGL